MTFISRAGRPAAAARAEALYWLDAFVAFIDLEKHLILRQIALQSQKNMIGAFSVTIRAYTIVLAHAVFYQVIDRNITGGISYVDFNAAAFGMWMIFGGMERKANPSHINLASNVPLRIRWINLFIADLIWITLKVGLGIFALYLTFVLFPTPVLTTPSDHVNLPLLVGLVVLAGLLGAGMGMVIDAVVTAVPATEGLMETFTWFLFISSGIYDTYSSLPDIVRPIFVLNPAMTVIEFSRRSLCPGYPTGDLNLAYPVCAAFVLLVLGFLMNRHLNRVEVP